MHLRIVRLGVIRSATWTKAVVILLSPPAIVFVIQEPQQQPPPQVDFKVEVIGKLPMEAKVQDLMQLLGRRYVTASAFSRRYAPTILELITLVKPNPARPSGRSWDSIHALTIGFEEASNAVVVEYCVDACDFDPKTGAFNPRRRMVSYRASAGTVEERIDKKLRELKKFQQ